MILVITDNISLIIIINTVDITQRFNGYNMFCSCREQTR